MNTSRLNRLVAFQNGQEEHIENVGSPNVTIEPAYQGLIQRAVDFVRNKFPRLLENVSDIYGSVENSGVFGEYQTDKPHSISVDIRRIEDEVRNKLQGMGEEDIRLEIEKQIVSTLIHEATHLNEFSDHGQSSESGPEQAEQDAKPVIDQISSRDVGFIK